MGKEQTVAVIIPAFNEEDNVASLVADVKKEIPTVVVIDDGSSDKTQSRARECGAVVLKNEVNTGKGAAAIKGVKWCLENGFCPVILMDADRQHLPDKIKDFLAAHEKENCDLIIGNRMAHTEKMPFVRLMTNRFMSWVVSQMTGYKIMDTQCGYRLYGKRVMDLHSQVDFRCLRFDYESEVIFYSAEKKFKICEVDVPTIYIEKRKSKIRPFKDALRWFKALLQIRKRIREMKEA